MDHIKLLLIDEKSLTASLDRAGYREKGVLVYTAQDYKSALNLISEKGIDVVSLNLDYNKENSFNVLKQLKENISEQDTPLIVTSVQATNKAKKKALEIGADLFVEKPIPRDFFIEKIKATLSQAVRDTTRISAIGEIHITGSHGEFSLPISDLSSTGTLVEFTDKLNEGDSVDLSLKLEDHSYNFPIKGSIVRIINNNNKQGVGIRFDSFKGNDKSKLQKYIDKHQIKSSGLKYYM